jgi:hypothetical protein
MPEVPEGTAGFALVEAVAGGLRRELGRAMEDQPGGPDDANAGQVNRAFRIVVRVVLGAGRTPDDPGVTGNVALDRLARRRLAACGLTGREIDYLIVDQAGGRDDWLAFLVLTAREEIELLLQSRPNDPDPAA